jgi:hypothetical protein
MPMQLSFGGKCPCCNNPWNKADNSAEGGDDAGEDFDLLCAPCKTETEKEPPAPGINPADFNTSVSPGEDFYMYAIGGTNYFCFSKK